MLESDSLILLALDFLGENEPNCLAPSHGFSDSQRLRLQQLLSGLPIVAYPPNRKASPLVVTKLSAAGASDLRFNMPGRSITLADYFRDIVGCPLEYPDIVCVRASALYLCYLLFGSHILPLDE
jgi:eukaryotic translation initiation factor 2C